MVFPFCASRLFTSIQELMQNGMAVRSFSSKMEQHGPGRRFHKLASKLEAGFYLAATANLQVDPRRHVTAACWSHGQYGSVGICLSRHQTQSAHGSVIDPPLSWLIFTVRQGILHADGITSSA